MFSKLIGISLAAVSVPLFAMSLALPGAHAVQVSSTVEAVDACQWQISGVPDQLNMTFDINQNPNALTQKYIGDPLVVSGLWVGFTFGLSGSKSPETALDGTSTECSFYSDLKQSSVDLAMTVSDIFSAYYIDALGNTQNDTAVTFPVSATRLYFELKNPSASCAEYFGSPGTTAVLGGISQVPGVAYSLPETGQNNYLAGAAPRCSADWKFQTTIPPVVGAIASPGSDYKWSGPVLTFTLDITDIP